MCVCVCGGGGGGEDRSTGNTNYTLPDVQSVLNRYTGTTG